MKRLGRKFKPTKPNALYTRTLYNAKRQTSGSLIQGKNAASTWLWFKGIMNHAWRNTTPTALQIMGHSQPINAAYDVSLSSGIQATQTFTTLGRLYFNYFVKMFYTKNTWVLKNTLPTGATQSIDLMLIDWFDTNSDAITQLNLICAGSPAVTWQNIYDRIKNMQQNIRIRRKQITQGVSRVTVKFSRKYSVAQFFANAKTDFRRPVYNVLSPYGQQRWFGSADTLGSPSNPADVIYYHNVIINLGALTDVGSVFPTNDATNSQLTMDTGLYTQFYTPIISTGPLAV